MKAVYYLLPLGLALSLAYALDQDADGISDVYAEHHGLTAGSGSDDPDGDGQTNAEESAWGTDPFDNDSKQTAAYNMVGSLYDFSVPTLVGKRYQFQGISDLVTTWMDIDIPFEGTGNSEHLLTTTPIAGTDKFFWRVITLPEPDADDDGLGAFEESLLSTSDHLKDSDGDKVTDLVEFLEGLNPALNTDTDGDGLSDDWEVFSGTDPDDDGSVDPDNGPDGDINGDGTSNQDAYNGGVNGSTTIGPVNLEVGGSLSGGVALSFKPEHSSSGNGYPADLYDAASVDGWEAEVGDYIEIWDEDDEGVFDTFIELQSHWGADGIKQEFEMMPDSQLTFILAYKGRYDEYDFGGNTQNAFSLKVEGASEVLVNEVAAQPDGNALGHSFMADDDTEADPLPYENWSFVSVTITAGPEATNNDGSVDLTLSLVPDELTDDMGDEVTYGGFVQLLKVDVEVPELDSDGNETGEYVTTDELKIAKWENAFSGGNLTKPTLKEDFITSDIDRFKVSFPWQPGLGKIEVELSVQEGSQTIDDATKIELNEVPAGSGNYESNTMILVFDEVDDGLEIDGVADNELNDRTHEATVNSKVVINYEDLFEHEVDVYRRGKITITPVIVRLESGGTRSTLTFSAQATLEDAKEAYGQVGIDLDIKQLSTIDPPSGVNLQDAHGVTVLDESGAFTPEAIALVGTGAHDDIKVYFVNKIYSEKYDDTGFIYGASLTGTNNILIATGDGSPNGIVALEPYNFAHELTHQLTGLGHPLHLIEQDQYVNLLWSVTEGSIVITADLSDPVSPRRLTEEHESLIHAHESVK